MKRSDFASSAPLDSSVLPSRQFDRLQDMADRFAAARKRGPVADWSIYLPAPADELYRSVLQELISLDLEASWQDGKGPMLEEYLARFPALGNAVSLPVALIVEEYRVRLRHGVDPGMDEYFRRFPKQASELLPALEQLTAPTRLRALPPPEIGPSLAPSAQPASHAIPFSGSFRLIEPIGRGTFGEVWRGETPSGVPVAIKVLNRRADDEQAPRELQSLELVKRLRHPCLLGTIDYWTHDHRLYVALELADGTLHDVLKSYRKQGKPGIPAAELVGYIRDAAEGLDYLHSQKVLHRDVKPDNILLHHGRGKIGDFGLARPHTHSMTNTSFAGTPLFMAPEIWEGKATARSDQYSLAFTYAELRLGRRPIAGGDMYEIMKNTLEKEPDLEGMGHAEAVVVRRALSKFPEQRFRTCLEFATALQAAVLSGAVPAVVSEQSSRPAALATPPAAATTKWSFQRQPSSSPARRRLIITVLFVGVFAALVGLGIPMNKRPEQIPDPKSDSVTIEGQVYAKQLHLALPNGQKIAFILLHPGANSVLQKPCYIMQTKVSNAVYDEFSNQTRMFGKWRRRQRNPALPVFELEVEEAHACAQWLGGRLPTPRELEFAAGYPFWKGARAGPAEGPIVAVNSKVPWPVHDPKDDISPQGIYHLSGNGREFTQWVTRGDGGFIEDESEVRKVPLPTAVVNPSSDKVVLRGWSFTERDRLTYDDLASHFTMRPMVQGYKQRDPHTTFRVVIDLKDARTVR